jgi:putative cell wall-binding protein
MHPRTTRRSLLGIVVAVVLSLAPSFSASAATGTADLEVQDAINRGQTWDIVGGPVSFVEDVQNVGSAPSAAGVPYVVRWDDQQGGGDAALVDVTATGSGATACTVDEAHATAVCELGPIPAGGEVDVAIAGDAVDRASGASATNGFAITVGGVYQRTGGWGVIADEAPTPTATVTRAAGDDRYATSVAAAKTVWPDTAPVVFVASGTDFPDALSAGPAAAHEGGPLLLTARGALPGTVAAELRSLHPRRVVVVGGPSAVSDDVLPEVAQAVPGARVDRVAGVDRYETNQRINADAFPDGGPADVWVATGSDYPDALAAGAAAGFSHGALVLVPGQATILPKTAVTSLEALRPTKAYIAGGTAAVSNGIQIALEQRYGVDGVVRRAGSDRYVTAQQISQTEYAVGYGVGTLDMASGAAFPDALSAAAAAAATGKPLLLAKQGCVPDFTRIAVDDAGPTSVTLVGGPTALGDGVAAWRAC